MGQLETARLLIRPFKQDDWRDLYELALDWNAAPGPAFDKWPCTEGGCREFAEYLAAEPRYSAVCLRSSGKVIGLLAQNGVDANRQLDLGHVIHSRFQDDDLDREALGAIVGSIFGTQAVSSIVTRNAREHAEQLAPLQSLGFRPLDPAKPGELTIPRSDWERSGPAKREARSQ